MKTQLINLSLLTLTCLNSISMRSQDIKELAGLWDREKELYNEIPFRIKNKWGFSDTTGKIIIPPQFDSVKLFQNNYAIVKYNKKMGLVDRIGKRIDSLGFDSIIYDAYEEIYIAKNNSENSWRNISQKESEIKSSQGLLNSGLRTFSNSNDMMISFPPESIKNKNLYDTAYADISNSGIYYVRKNKKWGVLNSDDSLIIPMMYERIEKSAIEGYYLALRNNYWGILNSNGKEIIPFEFDKIIAADKFGFVLEKNKLQGCYYPVLN